MRVEGQILQTLSNFLSPSFAGAGHPGYRTRGACCIHSILVRDVCQLRHILIWVAVRGGIEPYGNDQTGAIPCCRRFRWAYGNWRSRSRAYGNWRSRSTTRFASAALVEAVTCWCKGLPHASRSNIMKQTDAVAALLARQCDPHRPLIAIPACPLLCPSHPERKAMTGARSPLVRAFVDVASTRGARAIVFVRTAGCSLKTHWPSASS